MVAPTEAPKKDDTVVIEGGVYKPGYKDAIPDPGTMGNLWDMGIGGVQTAIDYLQAPVTLLRDATSRPGGDANAAAAMQGIQDAAIDTKEWLGRHKTPHGRDQDEKAKTGEEDKKGWLREAGDAVVGNVGPAVIADLGGPLGAGIYGLGSVGAQGLHIEEQLRNLPPGALEKTQKYQEYKDRGFSDEQIKQRLYSDMRTSGAILPDLVANTLFGGVVGGAISRMGTRSAAQSMTQSIIRNVLKEVPQNVVGAVASGAAGEYGMETAQIAGGLRPQGYDSDAIWKSGTDLAQPVGIISTALALANSRRGRPSRAPINTTGELMKDANARRPITPEIGIENRVVAAENLSGDTIKNTPTTGGEPTPAPAPPEPGVTPPSKPTEAPTAKGPQFHDYNAVTDALEDVEHMLRSMDAAGPEQKATPEWIQGHHELLEHHENLRDEQRRLAASRSEEGAGEDTVPGPTVGGVEVPGPTPPTPTPTPTPAPTRTAAVKAAVAKAAEKTTKVADDAAGAAVPPGEAPNEFTVDQLKARAADVERTPDMGVLQQHIAEWQRANPGQKLSDLNVIRATAKAAIEAERQKVTNQERLDQQRLIADRKLRNRDKKGEAAQRAIAKKQAAGYARAAVARERVEAAKKKGKLKEQEVTQPGKSEEEVKPTEAEAETPKPVDEVPTIGHNAPPEEVANVNTLRAKLGLKPVGAGVTHGSAATEAVDAAQQERQGRLREAEGTVVKGLLKAEDTGRDTEGAANRRDPRYSERETLAKETMKRHQPQGNYINHLEEVTDLIKKGDPTDDTVKKAVAGLVEDAKKVFDEYKGEVDKRSSGPKDVIWNIARGGGKSRATKKGDYHAFMSDLNNFVIGANEAIKKSEDKGLTKKQQAAAATKAKELALKHLDDSKLVREGDMETLVGQRGEKNAAVSMVKRTFSNQKGELDRLSKDQLDRLSPEDRASYNEEVKAEDAKLRREAAGEEEKAVASVSGRNTKTEDDVAQALAENPVKMIKPSTAKARGIPIPKVDPKTGNIMKDRNGRMIMIDPMYPKETVGRAHEYNNGKPEELHENNADDLEYRLKAEGHVIGDELKFQEISDIFRAAGEPVSRGTVKDLLRAHRPDDPHLRPIFDAVYDVVKDMPVEIWTRDAMVAYSKYTDPDEGIPLGFYDPMSGHMVIRRDAQTPMVIFHESIHAATSRAILGSERLEALVGKLQDIIESRHKTDIDITAELPWQRAIRGVPKKGQKEGPKINAREFVAELFSRPELGRLLSETNLTPAEARALKKLGYRADIGQSILKTLWHEFLEAIGFKASNPNAYKVSVDLLQDMFEREMKIRETDQARGTLTGQILTHDDRVNLWKADRIGGAAAIKQFEAGNYPEATAEIMRMNERGFPNEKSADAALKLLDGVNKHYWRDNTLEVDPPVPIKTVPEVHEGVVDFIERRLGPRAADKAWQFENKFATPLRHFVSGMQYTNDIGRHLEGAFQTAIQPLKDAWANRESFTHKYMDDTGANKLIDDIATMKHAIKDRALWGDFENLLIRESYAQARSDHSLGMGDNEHVKAGDLRWRQTEKDYKENKVLLDSIAKRNPDLVNLRNRIYDFTRKELETRQTAGVRDMLLRMKVVDPSEKDALSGFTKEIRRDDTKITPVERKAMDRVLKLGRESDEYKNWALERDRLARTDGKDSDAYKKHASREAKLLTNIDSKEYANYKKSRNEIRNIVDFEKHNGPHVPFMRHGEHAVYAEYDVTPNQGVEYNQVDPTSDLQTQYDFKKESDAKDFIDNTLSHPDVNITMKNAYSVIYDKKTGARAAHWTVEKPDRSAKTYTDQHEAEASMEKGDTISKKFTTPNDVKQMRGAGQDVSHLEERHRVVFNPREFAKFESEREATNYRNHLDRDQIHPNVVTRVSNVETPHEMIGRANVAYTSAEMKNWIKREEQSDRYKRMDPSEKAEWSRQLRVHAARVTATAGRRTAHMPREYAKGASTDILKNMIDYAGSSARAVADLTYRNAIDRGLEGAEGYVDKYRNQSGGMGKDHRARDDALREIKARLFAPPQVNGTWTQGIKRALQVSMISHLADTAYLVVNAIEPWVFGASISSARHGWAPTYGEMASTTKMLDAKNLAALAWEDIKAGAKGKYGANRYEKALVDTVTGARNTRGDGEGISKMLHHLFDKGLAARDAGTEVERIHDPSKNVVFRQLDRVDSVFRGFNTGVEIFNRSLLGIANYRLEYRRAMKEMGLEVKPGELNEKAHEQATRYAEDMIFKAAGDYGAWNSPRYFNNPLLKLATQFKKYPLRIASVYMDAAMRAFKGDHEAQKQLAYMTLAQVVAAGGFGLPINSVGAGVTNAMYMLGLTDSNYDDVQWAIHKRLADVIGVNGAELALKGALRFSGADFSTKLAQDSFLFHGSPTSRRAGDYIETLGKTALGAPGHWLEGLVTGVQKTGQGVSDIQAGATTQGVAAGMEGLSGILQIKALTDIIKATNMAFGGPKGMPAGTPVSAGDVISTGLGFQPRTLANKAEAKGVEQRLISKDSAEHTQWMNRWLKAEGNPTEQSAVWAQIQKRNANVADPRLRIQYQDLWKAKQRQDKQARQDDSKLGVRTTGRAKAFADVGNYFNTN